MKKLVKFVYNWVSFHFVEICVWLTAACLILIGMTGCASHKSSVHVSHDTITVTKLDSVYMKHILMDSLFHRDSIYVKEVTRNDTIFITRLEWHDRWHSKMRSDTVYKTRVDSIYISKSDSMQHTITKTVEKELNWWQKLRLWMGNLMLLIIVFYIGWIVFLVYKRYFSIR